MPQPPRKRRYSAPNQELDQMIDALISSAGGSPDADLLREMIVSVLRVREDKIDRGDLKILNSSLKELRYAFSVYTPYRRVRKVALFGSARTKNTDPNYLLARDFAKKITEKNWMVITGAAHGIMHAGNEGAGRTHSFGANIRLPFEQSANPFIVDDPKLVTFKYFFTRKLIFIKESEATVLFPGGFGTHDEGFETLTLVQTGKSTPRPIVLMDSKKSTYWKSWLRFLKQHLGGEGMIDPNDLSLIHSTHDADDAVNFIVQFYSNYHSARYIQDRLIFRIQRALPKAALEKLSGEFKDILVKGNIEQYASPFKEEENEPHTAEFIRLAFYFDRHHVGRLYQLIHRINQF